MGGLGLSGAGSGVRRFGLVLGRIVYEVFYVWVFGPSGIFLQVRILLRGIGFMPEIWCMLHSLYQVLGLSVYTGQYCCIVGFILWVVECWWYWVQVHGIWVHGESITVCIGF